MADEKEEVLANLYAIRAVISAAYLEYDESEKIKAEYAGKLAPSKEQEAKLNEEKSKLEGEIKNEQREMERAEMRVQTETKLGKERTRKDRLILAGLILLYILWTPAFVVLAYNTYYWLYNAMVVGNGISSFFFFLVLILVYILTFMAWGIAVILTGEEIKYRWKHIKNIKQMNKDRKRIIKEKSESASLHAYRGDQKKTRLETVQAELAQHQAEIFEIESERDALYAPYVTRGNVIYDAGIEKYGHYLRESDWESVDYLIYLLETNRADTLKEALQQYDAERRKNEIVQCIQQAVTFVGTTISNGLQRIEKTVSTELAKLDKVVAEKLEAINAKMEAQNKQLSNVSEQLKNVGQGIRYIGQVTTYNAALNKMIMHNTSEMVRGINQLKTIASSPIQLSASTIQDLKRS